MAEPGSVVKVIEVVGSSATSFSDAVRNAVRTASATVRSITRVDVISSSADDPTASSRATRSTARSRL